MVLQRHLAIGLLDVVRVQLRRKAQPKRVIETVLSTTIHLKTPSSSDVFGQPPLAGDTTPALWLFANFWGVKLRDSDLLGLYKDWREYLLPKNSPFRAFRPFARRRLVAALSNGGPQVLPGGLESGVLITMVEGEVLRVAFEEEGRRPG